MAESEYADGKKFPAVKHIVDENGITHDSDQQSAEADLGAITASTAPAGGSGATAGAYDTSTNRDLMIASLTATQVDVAALRTKLNALLAKLRTYGIIAS